MKHTWGWVLGIVLFSGLFFYFTTFFSYEASSAALSGFPVPKSAILTEENEVAKLYEWNRASEENGIPLGYEVVLKANGWEKGSRQGASVRYTKGQEQIDVISATNRLILIRIQ